MKKQLEKIYLANVLLYFSTYKDLYTAGLGAEVAGYGATSTVKVPVDPAYPTDYLAANHNTAGRVTSLMLPAATE